MAPVAVKEPPGEIGGVGAKMMLYHFFAFLIETRT
jgi:hypothetical protein